jgi:hypothetical protein
VTFLIDSNEEFLGSYTHDMLMEKIKWAHGITNDEVFQTVKEERSLL